MRKISKYIVIIAMLLMIFSSVNCIKAEENEYGYAKAWIKLNNEEWQKAPVDNISLDIYESFYVKTEVKTKVECFPSLVLEGAGTTKTFEVIEGPSKYDEVLGWAPDMKPAGWNETFIWKVRPTDNKFAGGHTPLKLLVQFQFISGQNRDGINQYDHENIYLNLVYPLINNKIWEGYNEDNTQTKTNNSIDNNIENNDTPGFEIILLLLAIYFIILYKKRRY